MLLEDSKKLEKYRNDQLAEKERKAFEARKQRLKEDISIDLEEQNIQKKAGRPKGKKDAKPRKYKKEQTE